MCCVFAQAYYSSSQTSVLVTTGASEKFHYDMRFEKKRCFSETNSSLYSLQVPDILTFSHHLLMLLNACHCCVNTALFCGSHIDPADLRDLSVEHQTDGDSPQY